MSIAAARTDPESKLTAVLIGNPNVGKTSLFNALTGLSHRVGNYPGVTVERRAGQISLGPRRASVLDLPGTYSLAARSPDEMLVIDLLLGQLKTERRVDLILAILDASNLERNLYLLSQLSEFGIPLVASLNMVDVAERRGIKIDVDALSSRLGIPVVPTRADRGVGIGEIRKALERQLVSAQPARGLDPEFPAAFREEWDRVWAALNREEARLGRSVSRVEALRALVDAGGYAEARLRKLLGSGVEELLAESRRRLAQYGELPKLEAEARYRNIRSLLATCLRAAPTPRRTLTDRIDSIVTHRVWGTLTLLLVLGAVFQSIYSGSAPLMEGIEKGVGWIGAAVASRMAEGPLRSLIVDGGIGGVGAVVTFLPQIAVLFLFIALLEDCGYMARAAFLMDKLLSGVGLSGRSVIPLISSFACAVPGIMATRTIDNRRQRLATILVAPLMSCSARLPVYVLFIGAFVPATAYFGGWLGLQGLTLLAMHLVGVAVAVPTLWALNRTFLRGPTVPFLMELPSYKVPNLRTVSERVYSSSREFLVRAGTIIFALTIVVWAASYFPRPEPISGEYDRLRASAPTEKERTLLDRQEAGEYLRQSYFGRMGRAVEPIVRPLGWDWRIGMAALASFPAREVIISTLGTVYNLGEEGAQETASLVARLRSSKHEDGSPVYSLAVALSIMVFVALCCQCGATLATIKRETSSWGWPALTFAYMTLLAYAGAFVTYRLAGLLDL